MIGNRLNIILQIFSCYKILINFRILSLEKKSFTPTRNICFPCLLPYKLQKHIGGAYLSFIHVNGTSGVSEDVFPLCPQVLSCLVREGDFPNWWVGQEERSCSKHLFSILPSSFSSDPVRGLSDLWSSLILSLILSKAPHTKWPVLRILKCQL